ncbi:MAG TPA: RNA polymerase sigma-54 factor, partial [Bacteroidales bacterium]
MLNQRLQQKLLQKLSPQQILLMKLLQIPSQALEQRIKQEIEENPALEELDEDYDSNNAESEDDSLGDSDEKDRDNEEFDISDYMDDDDTPAYKLSANNTSTDDERREIPFASGTSFHETLISQLGMQHMSKTDYQIALNIIGNLDDAGYLQRDLGAMVDDLAFSQNISTTRGDLERILAYIQQFDPPGVGARNLQECLLIQLRRKPQTVQVITAGIIIERFFEEFTKKHYEKITKKNKITNKELKDAIDEILKLNPKPGDSLSDDSRLNQYIIPDFIIQNKDGDLDLSLNSRNAPELRLSRTYTDMLETYSEDKNHKSHSHKEAVMFIKQKIDSARWFIDAIKQRQN